MTLAGVDADICGGLLEEALGRGAEYAELFFEQREVATYNVSGGAVSSASHGSVIGLAVRVLNGEGVGLAFTEDLRPERMLETARAAAQIAQGHRGSPALPLGERPLPSCYQGDRQAFPEPRQKRTELLGRTDAAARAFDPRIVHVDVVLSEGWRDLVVACSDGTLARDRQPMVRINVHAVARSPGDRRSARWREAARRGLGHFDLPGHTPEDLGRRAAEGAVQMLEAVDAPTGPMPVVLGNGGPGILIHEAVGHGLEADVNRTGASVYAGQMGCRVASPACTMVDDGSIPDSRGSINVDDEGTPGQRTILIDRGILAGYLHDRASARHFGANPTGNGRRESYRHRPIPRMTNTFLAAGPYHPEEVLRSVKKGILVKDLTGGQVDVSTGDFVFGVNEGYLIEDGHIGPRLKFVSLIGNGPRLLRELAMVGNDFRLSEGDWTCGKSGQSVPVGLGSPTFKVGEMTVGGTRR